MNNLKSFMTLFTGSNRSYGQFNPETGYMVTKEGEITKENVRKHLLGEIGLGVVPITDDGTCLFAAIDIDNHKGETIDHEALYKKVVELKLPLIVCRSKSGGAHLYMFGVEPLQVKTVRPLMRKWTMDLGYPGEEIFPKQDYLRLQHDGSRALGNWINIPYFGNPTERYAFDDKGPITLDLFLLNAKSSAVTQNTLEKLYFEGHPDAPPCLQQVMAGKIEEGYRNEALYSLTIYLKKAFKDDYRDKAFDMNSVIFDNPLPYQEANKTITSASKRVYKYKCSEEPIKSLCNRKVCLKRKFGISSKDADHLDAVDNMPEFTELRKYETDPVKWELIIGGKSVFMCTNTLTDYRLLRKRIMEEMLVLPPILNVSEWDQRLSVLMENVIVIEAPDDASTSGIIRRRLYEFLEKTDLNSDGEDVKDREALLRGQPIVQNMRKDGRRVVFKGTDFVSYLKYTRSEELKGTDLWMALRKAGVKHGRIRINNKVTNIWHVSVEKDSMKFEDIDFDPQF